MKRFLILITAALLIISGCVVFSDRELQFTKEALAAEANMSISITCIAPPIITFTPRLSYTFQFAANEGGIVSGCDIMANIYDPVNGDSAPTVSCSLDKEHGTAIGIHAFPKAKVGGLQCHPYGSAMVSIADDGIDNPSIDVSVAPPNRPWLAKRVDGDSTEKVLFGQGSVLNHNEPIKDGEDGDFMKNGEIEVNSSFGEMVVKFDYPANMQGQKTYSENLIFRFSPL